MTNEKPKKPKPPEPPKPPVAPPKPPVREVNYGKADRGIQGRFDAFDKLLDEDENGR